MKLKLTIVLSGLLAVLTSVHAEAQSDSSDSHLRGTTFSFSDFGDMVSHPDFRVSYDRTVLHIPKTADHQIMLNIAIGGNHRNSNNMFATVQARYRRTSANGIKIQAFVSGGAIYSFLPSKTYKGRNGEVKGGEWVANKKEFLSVAIGAGKDLTRACGAPVAVHVRPVLLLQQFTSRSSTYSAALETGVSYYIK